MNKSVFGLRVLACAFAASMAIFAHASAAVAEDTQIVVRVIAKGAKFIGSSMGGVEIQIRDVATGELLAQGVTQGGTGDTARLMSTPLARGDALSTPGAAAFVATIDLDRPRLLELRARGPLSQLQSAVTVTSQQWVIPGKHINEGDGWLIEMPGLAVDVSAPSSHAYLAPGLREVMLRANVTMMCGCGVSPGGAWDANGMEVAAQVERNGEFVGEIPLSYAGETSQFAAPLSVEPGTYVVRVVAWQPATGNAGVDTTSFIVR
ncbi:MAG: hypothetical protein Tsb0010_11660 [Parvularculaceae bacterium]